MASTFSQSLRIELIGNGDQSGTWGTTTNNNLGTLIEQGITGVQSIVMSDANYTLTNFNGIADEARNAVLVVTGANNSVRDLIPPLVEKIYTIVNNTTGGYAIRVIGSSGTGVNIPNGTACLVYSDGTNFYSGLSGTAGNFSVNGALSVTSTANLGGALTGTTATFSGAISSVSPNFTGTPTAITAAPGTNTTQIATTAFVLANGVPSGSIIMWSGSIASIPSGWLLCNGSSGTPDLRDRFVVGAGSTYAVNATGGTADAIVVSHTHAANSAVADPGHSHTAPIFFQDSSTPRNQFRASFAAVSEGTATTNTNTTGITVATTITTAGSSGINQNLPPYYALAYIMKA